jgi:hypothetical protein
MGGKDRDPAGVIRRLIDFGPDEGLGRPEGAHQENAEHSRWAWRTEGSPRVSFADPLAAPWDTFRAVVLAAGASRRDRIRALYDVLGDLPNRAEVLWRVNQADMTTEPPFPQADYPEVFEDDVAVYDLWKWGKDKISPSPESNSVGSLSPKGEVFQVANFSHEKIVGAVRTSGSRTANVRNEVSSHSPQVDEGKNGGGLDMAMASADTRRMVRVKASEAFEPRPPTQWLDEESGPERMNQRLVQVMRAHDAPHDIPLEYLSVCQFNLRQLDDQNLFFRHVFEMEAGLVVVDALADVMPGADENSVKDVVPVFRGLRQVAASTGAAVMVIHHANKSGGYRGSSHMQGAVELMLMAQSKQDSRFVEFQSVKTRDTGSIHFAAQIHFEPEGSEAARVWLSPAGTAEAGVANRKGDPFSEADRYVLDYLFEYGESGRQALLDDRGDLSVGYIDKALKNLRERGLIERVNEGKQGMKAFYDLTEEGGKSTRENF